MKIYPATVNDPSVDGDVKGNGYSLSKVKHAEAIKFEEIKPDAAKSETFGDYENVQTNAIPKYRWKRFEAAPVTNFIIECSWPQDTNYKETDVAYLIAKS